MHLYPSFLPVRTSMRTFARTHSIFVRRLRAQTLINLFSIDMHQTSDVQVNGKLFASAGFLEMHSHMQLFSHSVSTRMCLTTIQQTEAMVQSLSMQLQRFTQNKRSSGGDADDDATSALQQQVRNKSIARPWPDHGQIRISPLFKGARVHIILHNHSSPTSLRLVRDHGQIWAHPRLIIMSCDTFWSRLCKASVALNSVSWPSNCCSHLWPTFVPQTPFLFFLSTRGLERTRCLTAPILATTMPFCCCLCPR